MRRRWFAQAALAVTLTAAGSLAQAQDPQQQQRNSATGQLQGAMGASDKDVVKKMYESNLAEIQLGQMASSRATDEQVKSFAQQMVTDHGQANEELRPIAQRLNIEVPTEVSAKHKAAADRLSQLQGTEFDREFMKTMVDSHKDALKLARSAAGHRDDDHNPVPRSDSEAGGLSGAGTTAGTSGSGSSAATGTSGEAAGSGASASGSAAAQTPKAYAAKTAPIIQQHLQHAQELEKMVGRK
jgi:putative membrane protein